MTNNNDQPENPIIMKLILANGNEFLLSGLIGKMVTPEGEQEMTLSGTEMLESLSIVEVVVGDAVEIIVEDYNDYGDDADMIGEWELNAELIKQNTFNIDEFFGAILAGGVEVVEEEDSGFLEPDDVIDDMGMHIWEVDRIKGGEFVPNLEKELEIGGGWYFDGSAVYRRT